MTSPEAPHLYRCFNTDTNGNLKDNTANNEWLSYSVYLTKTAVYQLTLRMRTTSSTARTLRVEIDGVDRTGSISHSGATWHNKIVNTNGAAIPFRLHTVRVYFTAGSQELNYIDWVAL